MKLFICRIQRRCFTISGPAPPVMLAHPYKKSDEISGWFVSEKLDGVRAFWWKNKLQTRNGSKIPVPIGFKQEMDYFFPGGKADGELFIRRDYFQQTMSAVGKIDNKNVNWKTPFGDVKFHVFDIPPILRGKTMKDTTAIKRMQALANVGEKIKYSRRDVLFVDVVKTSRLPINPALAMKKVDVMLQNVLGRMGEGLMLRNPESLYVDGRSHELLKVKEMNDDEALVFDIALGLGKHEGLIGALRCVLMSGVTFECGVGLSDQDRAADASLFIGKVVTVKHQGMTDKGVPRFPQFIGMRPDRCPDEFRDIECMVATVFEEQQSNQMYA